jgi:hypothetical protein
MNVIESLSRPSWDVDWYFSVALTTPEHPAASQVRLPAAVFVAVPVESVTMVVTSVPVQTGMRCAVSRRDPGSTMCPVIAWTTFALLVGLWPFAIVATMVSGQTSAQIGAAVGVAAGVAVGVAAVYVVKAFRTRHGLC